MWYPPIGMSMLDEFKMISILIGERDV